MIAPSTSTAPPWTSTSPAPASVPPPADFSPPSPQAWTENPADPAFESKVDARHAAPGPLLRARRRYCRRRQRRRHPRQGIRASFPDARPRRNPHGRRRSPARARALSPRSPSAPAAALSPCASADSLLRLGAQTLAARPRLRAALDARLPPQARRPHPLHRPVQPVGRLAAHGRRPGADLARHARRAPLFRVEFARRRPAPRRSGRRQARRIPADGFMPGMDVRAQLTVVGDGPVGAVGQALDAALRPPARPRAPRVGAGHEVRHRTA